MNAETTSVARAAGRFLAARLRTACLVIFLLGLIQALAHHAASASACEGPCARAVIPSGAPESS